MKQQDFLQIVDKHKDIISAIRDSAHALHAAVNQHYDKVHPYGFHLDMVAHAVEQFGHAVCNSEADIIPLFFGAYYHDSIEDARQTYNDVKRIALRWMTEPQALMAAEIVYALTNEKGRTRAERANDTYYRGIRETPYAPCIKLADRLANITYSFTHSNDSNVHMKDVYRSEWPHFLQAITTENADVRFALPQEMIQAIEKLIAE